MHELNVNKTHRSIAELQAEFDRPGGNSVFSARTYVAGDQIVCNGDSRQEIDFEMGMELRWTVTSRKVIPLTGNVT